MAHSRRIAIDGSQTDELVDDEARAMARQQIERLQAKQKAREARAEPAPPVPEKTADLDNVPSSVEVRKRDGLAALRQAHRNRTAAL